MGILSRKKVQPSLPTPLPTSILTPSSQEYAKKESYYQSEQFQPGMSQDKSSSLTQGGVLPSPPGSPVDAHGRSYSQGKPYSTHSQPRPLQFPNQSSPRLITETASTSRLPVHSSDGRDFSRTTPSSFSSDASNFSNVLYNDQAAVRSSAGTAISDREVEGKMGSLGLERRSSSESVEMHDGTQRHSQAQTLRAPPPKIEPEPERFIETPVVVTEIMSPTPSQASAARKTSSRYNLADFAFIRTLGTGSFGRVHLVRSKHNSRSYAVKVLSKERVVKMKQVEHTNSEREMLERVRHPFLVNLWGTFKCSKNLYMVMDFVAGGELFSLLRKSQRFPDPVAKFFAAEVALGLDYLHSLDIIYRDLKPENILLGADGHVKITDFGFAKHVPDITWTLCGTPDYLAPEIVQSRGYNKSVDWYALGVLMFEMLAGYPPFFTEDANPMRLYEKIIAGKVRYPSYFAPEAKDLLKSLLTSDITKRFGNLANGSRDIFGHTWFQEVDWERLYRKEIPAPYVPKVENDGDASNFDSYPEVDTEEYGQPGPDPHGGLFASF